jgi:hypothetical protein
LERQALRKLDSFPEADRSATQPFVDFPIFHLDLLNNRMLIALVAVTHVIISHGMASR